MLKTAAQTICVAALLALLIGFEGRSQEPPQTGGAKQEQPQAAEASQPGSQQPQAAPPPPTIIYVQPPAKSAEEAEEDRRERHEKSHLDRRLVDLTAELSDYTGGLYRATVALVGATIILGIGTIGLVIFARRQASDMKASITATQKVADAAMLSAKAAIGVELPIIRANRFPGLVALDKPLTPDNPFRGGIHASAIGPYNTVPQIEFQNLGRTSAFPQLLKMGWQVVANLSTDPDYFHNVPANPTAIINTGGDFGLWTGAAVNLTEDQQERIRKEESFLWLYVALLYTDFLDTPHEARFCWRFTKGFGTGGNPPPAYTSST